MSYLKLKCLILTFESPIFLIEILSLDDLKYFWCRSVILSTLLVITILSSSNADVEITCDYSEIASLIDPKNNVPTCTVKALISADENVKIGKVNAPAGKNLGDVKQLIINDAKCQFIPKDVKATFSGLEAIQFGGGNLKNLVNLKELTDLKYLDVSGNKIER